MVIIPKVKSGHHFKTIENLKLSGGEDSCGLGV
jgi:hypothetical protein